MKEEVLWKRLKEGDKSALREIYDLQVEYLLQYALRFSRDEALIQDCVHDLFIEIWKNRERIGMTTAIRPYLIVSLRRKIVRVLQKGQKQEEFSGSVEFGRDESMEELMIQGEQSAEQSLRLQTAFQQLSQRQREAIFLKYYEEMDYQEVAQAMDINYQSVRNLIFNGLKKLREILVSLIFLLIFFEII